MSWFDIIKFGPDESVLDEAIRMIDSWYEEQIDYYLTVTRKMREVLASEGDLDFDDDDLPRTDTENMIRNLRQMIHEGEEPTVNVSRDGDWIQGSMETRGFGGNRVNMIEMEQTIGAMAEMTKDYKRRFNMQNVFGAKWAWDNANAKHISRKPSLGKDPLETLGYLYNDNEITAPTAEEVRPLIKTMLVMAHLRIIYKDEMVMGRIHPRFWKKLWHIDKPDDLDRKKVTELIYSYDPMNMDGMRNPNQEIRLKTQAIAKAIQNLHMLSNNASWLPGIPSKYPGEYPR